MSSQATTSASQLKGTDFADYVSSLGQGEFDSQQKKLKQQFDSLTDKEFDSFMHNYVMKNKDSGIDLSKKMKSLGIDFSMKPQGVSAQPMIVGASQLTLDVYSGKRGGDSYTRLYASWASSTSETSPASYDLVSIEWDPSVGAFYSADVGDATKASN